MSSTPPPAMETVALPCGHNFCVTCLVRLKASGSPVCPQCRQKFAEVELPGLSRMAKASGKSDFMKKEELVGCKVHKEPFVYWSTRSNELYCTTCMLSADINTSCLKRISDAIPMIQEDLERKAQAVKKGIAGDLANHKEERKKAVEELAKIITFEKSILKLKADYKQFIEKVDSHNSKLREKSASVNKIEENISEVHGEKDIGMVLSYSETLNELQKTFACQQPERIVKRDRDERIRHHSSIRNKRLLAIEYDSLESTDEAPISSHHLAYVNRNPDIIDSSHLLAIGSHRRDTNYSNHHLESRFGQLGIAYEAPISSHQVQHMMRPARLLSDIACVFEENEEREDAFIEKLQRERQRRNSGSRSSSGSRSASAHSHSSDDSLFGRMKRF